jgi:hypothetical protein
MDLAPAPSPRFPRKTVRYSHALMESLCRQIASGETLRTICSAPSMPSESTVRSWVRTNHEGCAAAFEAARAAQAHRLVDEILTFCDEQPAELENGRIDPAWVALQKLRIDTRKWTASRILPREYGEHVALKGDTAGGGLNIRIDLS